MEKLVLTKDNYYSKEADIAYLSSSQFKDFLKCQAYALAKIKGEWVDEKSDALLIGSYVDSYFSGELETFKAEHPEIFNSRTGELKAQFQNAEELIKVILGDDMLYEHLMGEHQAIYVGEINGVPFKGKFDSDFDDKIVDGKVMKDLEPVWAKNQFGRYTKVNFAIAQRYDIQGAIYQELKRQKTGKRVPFILDVVTKEKVPSKALLQIDNETLDIALEEVKEKAPHFQDIKMGLVEPIYCGKCDYCKSVLKVNKVVSFHEFDPADLSDYGNEEN